MATNMFGRGVLILWYV